MPYNVMKSKKMGAGSKSGMSDACCHTHQPKAPPGEPSMSKGAEANEPKKTETLKGR
jgi:hypothetical protein